MDSQNWEMVGNSQSFPKVREFFFPTFGKSLVFFSQSLGVVRVFTFVKILKQTTTLGKVWEFPKISQCLGSWNSQTLGISWVFTLV